MNLELEGKSALVAGSSRGIGLSIARAFLREGARVVITGRDADALKQAEQQLAGESGRDRVRAVRGDLREEAAIAQALKDTVGAFGRLDAVVPNVGSGRGKGGAELTAADWQEMLGMNLLGSVLLAHAAVPHLRSPGGSITFIASIAGLEAIGAPVPYEAAKAGLLQATKSLARLLGPKGLRVNAVAPGNVLFPGGTWERKLAENRQAVEGFISANVPLKRFGTPDEIADAVVFLSSARASFITGACLVADGGQTRSI